MNNNTPHEGEIPAEELKRMTHRQFEERYLGYDTREPVPHEGEMEAMPETNQSTLSPSDEWFGNNFKGLVDAEMALARKGKSEPNWTGVIAWANENLPASRQPPLPDAQQKLREANRYALATFRALDQYTFEDSDHALLIAEAVKKLEDFEG